MRAVTEININYGVRVSSLENEKQFSLLLDIDNI